MHKDGYIAQVVAATTRDFAAEGVLTLKLAEHQVELQVLSELEACLYSRVSDSYLKNKDVWFSGLVYNAETVWHVVVFLDASLYAQSGESGFVLCNNLVKAFRV